MGCGRRDSHLSDRSDLDEINGNLKKTLWPKPLDSFRIPNRTKQDFLNFVIPLSIVRASALSRHDVTFGCRCALARFTRRLRANTLSAPAARVRRFMKTWNLAGTLRLPTRLTADKATLRFAALSRKFWPNADRQPAPELQHCSRLGEAQRKSSAWRENCAP